MNSLDLHVNFEIEFYFLQNLKSKKFSGNPKIELGFCKIVSSWLKFCMKKKELKEVLSEPNFERRNKSWSNLICCCAGPERNKESTAKRVISRSIVVGGYFRLAGVLIHFD